MTEIDLEGQYSVFKNILWGRVVGLTHWAHNPESGVKSDHPSESDPRYNNRTTLI